MTETLDRSQIMQRLIENSILVAVLGFMAWTFYQDRKTSDAKFVELSERGIKAIENNNIISSRILDRLEPGRGNPAGWK
jgi:hypothetical protein